MFNAIYIFLLRILNPKRYARTKLAESAKLHNSYVNEYSRLKDNDPRKKEIENIWLQLEAERAEIRKKAKFI